MNFLKNIFNSETQIGGSSRIALTEADQIEDIINASAKEPILIFKHSTRCGISGMVLKRFDNKISNQDTPYYFLDILKYRPLSNLIQDKFDITHQSPQLLVIKNGKVIAHDSHYGILDVNI
jgi:bacillithiol system protein YtxJ